MVPLDLREFAESRYRDGKPFGRDLLELVDNEWMADSYLEIIKQLEGVTEKKFPDGEEWRHVEHLEDKAATLERLTDELHKAGYEGHLDEMITSLLAKLEDVETERDALKTGLEGVEADLKEVESRLAAMVKPLEYDL